VEVRVPGLGVYTGTWAHPGFLTAGAQNVSAVSRQAGRRWIQSFQREGSQNELRKNKPRKFRGVAVLGLIRVGIMDVLVTCDGMPRDAARSSVVASPWGGPHSHAGSAQSHPASACTAGAAEVGGWHARTVAPGGHLAMFSWLILLLGVDRPHRWQGQRRRSSRRQGPRPLAELPPPAGQGLCQASRLGIFLPPEAASGAQGTRQAARAADGGLPGACKMYEASEKAAAGIRPARHPTGR
jgi:hypothetical protein